MFTRRVKEVIPSIPVNSISSLIDQSKSALDLFKKTRDKLLTINGKIDVEITSREDEIVKLKEEMTTLYDTKVVNARLANNIEKIING